MTLSAKLFLAAVPIDRIRFKSEFKISRIKGAVNGRINQSEVTRKKKKIIAERNFELFTGLLPQLREISASSKTNMNRVRCCQISSRRW